MALTRFNVSRRFNLLLFLLFIGALMLAIWTVNIYRLTIMPAPVLAVLTLCGAFAGILVVYAFSKKQIGLLWVFFIGFVVGGSIVDFIVLYFNSRIVTPPWRKERFTIMETDHLGKSGKSTCALPYAIINFYGQEKQLVFYCYEDDLVQQASDIEITYHQGALGFPFIVERTLH